VYETDKSTALSENQREVLHRIIQDVIGSRQTQMFMLSRSDADHSMIQSLFPFKDKRSIRRVILQTKIFDDLMSNV
jgi:hypothetical protein